MDTTVFCPDCGGVIGGSDPQGRKLCICDDPSNRSGARPGMPDPVIKPKVCCKCGADLKGKKRFKDSLGYWCEGCHYGQKADEKGNHVPCDSCGRYIEPHKLQSYENIRICTRCVKERRDAGKKMRRPVVFGSEHRKHERRNLLVLLIIAGILLLVSLYGYLR